MEEYDYVLKLLLLGDSGVGKSSILVRFADDKFFENQSPTIGVDFKVKFMEVLGKKFKVSIWDTAGQERFRTVTSSYYKDAQGTCLIFDISRRDTFLNCGRWLSELRSNANNEDMILVLAGNKIDLEAQR
jgi:Ras-related protein Rab-18